MGLTRLFARKMGFENELKNLRSKVFELASSSDENVDEVMLTHRPLRRGVSKGVENGRRPAALRAGHPKNGHSIRLFYGWPACRA
jgi:hypothetical protein